MRQWLETDRGTPERIIEAVYRYPGPLDLGPLRAIAEHALALFKHDDSEEIADEHLRALRATLRIVYQAAENAPRHGVAACMHPYLRRALKQLLHAASTELLLFPRFQASAAFEAVGNHWQVLLQAGHDVPQRWASEGLLLEQVPHVNVPVALRDIPLLCAIGYSPECTENPLPWAGAFHELGHHLFYALCSRSANRNDRNARVADFSDYVSNGIVDSVMDSDAGEALFDHAGMIPAWMSELFADAVALRVIGLAYIPILRFSLPEPSDPQRYPPLGFRLRALGRQTCDMVALLREQSKDLAGFVAKALDVGAAPEHDKFPIAEEEDTLSNTRWYGPVCQELEAWLADQCLPLISDFISARQEVGEWTQLQHRPQEVMALAELLLQYVPPAGRPRPTTRRREEGVLTIEPASLGSIMLAGSWVRWHDFEEFSRPWPTEGAKAERALSNLMSKAVSIAYFEKGPANGPDRESDLESAEPR